MPETIPKDSVGVITPQTIAFDQPIKLTCGKTIARYELIYETYGTLNKDKSNAILICHALSGDHHAAGYHSMDDKKPGWWNNYIGPNKPMDTNKFFIVSLNNLGGCKGSTGPASIDPETQKRYGHNFPIVTVEDWIETQYRLMQKLTITKWNAVIGGSLGGMQVMQWSTQYPECLSHAVIIAAAPKLTAQNIAFNEVARQAIITDPDFHDGKFYEHNTVPTRGLMLARMLGHITYLSDGAMREKFGRELREGKINYDYGIEFQVESYLRYQGKSFVNRFDANTYLLMTKALDYFDPAGKHNDNLCEALETATCDFLVISFSTDWRFAPERSREIVNALLHAKKQVSYAEIEAEHGHDAFLVKIDDYYHLFSTYMEKAAKEFE
jgi:homoserine O-acetyltransferase